MQNELKVVKPHHGSLYVRRYADQLLVLAELPSVDERGEPLSPSDMDIGEDDLRLVFAFRDGSQMTRTLKQNELQYVFDTNPLERRRVTYAMTADESASLPEYIETPFALEHLTADGKRLLINWGMVRAFGQPYPEIEQPVGP